jgi:hypothetical protein
MPKLLISFKHENLRYGRSPWLFPTRRKARFEWLALMAIKRLTLPGDEAWTSVEEIAALPSWAGKTKHHITTNVGRYLQSIERSGISLEIEGGRWAGPYRLTSPALSIEFDVPLDEARKRLRLPVQHTPAKHKELLRFTLSYTRAQWLLYQGRLISPRGKAAHVDTAYKRLMSMTANRSYSPHLRLAACLAAVQVLYRLGQFRAARKILVERKHLIRRIADSALKAQYYLALAWADQRGASGTKSDNAVKDSLEMAKSWADKSIDRAAIGFLAHRTGGYLTKHGYHIDSAHQFIRALEYNLMIGNYDMVQASCGNIGSVIHRLGPRHYKNARRWLLLGIAVARWMKIGRDDAHSELILGKIYVEIGKENLARLWLQRAERIASRAANRVGLADIKMVWAFWHRRFGTRKDERDTLVAALRMFRQLKDFDWRQKEGYIERQFSEVWPEVVMQMELSGSEAQRPNKLHHRL